MKTETKVIIGSAALLGLYALSKIGAAKPPTAPPQATFSKVITYESLTDNSPPRTPQDLITIFQDLGIDTVFRSWFYRPLDFNTTTIQQTILNYTTTIHNAIPNLRFIPIVPMAIQHNDINWDTGHQYTETELYNMALDPAKWGISSPTKDQVNQGYVWPYPWWVPDPTNAEFQSYFLSVAKKYIQLGIDGIFIDLLNTVPFMLSAWSGSGYNHQSVIDTWNGCWQIVKSIRDYQISLGKTPTVGSWSMLSDLWPDPPFTWGNFDFIVERLYPTEVVCNLDQGKWTNLVNIRNARQPGVPIIGHLDIYSSNLLSESQAFARVGDATWKAQRLQYIRDTLRNNYGIIFSYPFHGDVINSLIQLLAYGTYNIIDAAAPELGYYNSIKQLIS